MTKKDFRTRCNTDHVFTGWNGKRIRINVIYIDYKENEQGRGYKYAVASNLENCTKTDLFNIAYDWIVNQKFVPYYVYSRFAQYDNQRFKVPVSFNPNSWN